MNGVEFLIGDENIFNISPIRVCDDEALAFIADVSSRLMKLPDIRNYSDIAALAFWGRKGNIERMKMNYPDSSQRTGRGLCFHIAPGNIPVNFAFSYFFGLISGCANIVRVPGKEFMQVKIILRCLSETLKDYPRIAERTAFVKYKADDNITAEFSRYSDARMIWGGDETISRIRSLPVPPRCVDVCFADRYSICIISGKAILQSDSRKIRRTGEDFYNDTYLMDQNACSSPQLILWIDDSTEAREIFWDSVYTVASEKYHLQSAISTEKYLHACEDAIKTAAMKITMRTNLLYKIELEKLSDDTENLRGKGGYFYEYSLRDIDELCGIVSRKFQTCTYFGIEPERIRDMITKHGLTGIDRIVPIGKAMDISVIWDGFDIVRTLSRIITISPDIN